MKQNLVELKGYVKNFRDGTISEHVKMKPMTGYRGRTTVQLFNAETGEIEQEVMSENVINNWIAKDSFDANFRGQVNGHKTDLFANPFAYLLLSDATVPENADAKELVGRMCGYSARNTYSGSAINRGTLNTAESWYSNRSTAGKTTAHLVFDFPTHAANGTIRTIYWAPSLLECSEVTSGNMPWAGIKRCTHWSYWNYPLLSYNPQVPFEQQYKLSSMYMGAVDSPLGRVNMTTKMFYGVAYWEGALCFSVVDIDRFNLSASDIVKCTYADGSVYTSYPTIMATHIDPDAQIFKILFYTPSSTSYKDMPLRYTFYEVTFNFSGATQSIKSFSRSLLVDNSRYPKNYDSNSRDNNGWYYTNSGELRLVDYYTTPSTSPVEYENYEFQFNDTLTAVTKVDTRPIIASCINERRGVTTYTEDSQSIKSSKIDYINFVKDDVISYYISSINIGNFIVRRSDNVCLYHSSDWSATSGTYRYYYGSNTLINYRSSGNEGCAFGQFTMLPSAQNLLPSDIVKTDVNTMKVQYDFIIDENNFVTDYIPNGGK